MINIERKQIAPKCLEKQVDYKCDDVLDKLVIDFYGKCYICETNFFSTNVEHFNAHKGVKILKFDWSNLFLVCGHCNNIKLTTDILNCTSDNKVEENLKYKSIFYPEQNVIIEAATEDELTKNTADLLDIFPIS